MTPRKRKARAMTDHQTLTGHTSAEHGDGGPVRHAWRCGWSDPDPLLEEAGQPARTRVALDLTDDAEPVALAVCGVALPHRIAQPFDPADERACDDCTRVLAPNQE